MELHGARVLAFGTGGAQGAGLIPAIRDRGGVAVLARSRPGAGDVVADLTDTASVLAAATGVDAVALHIPLGLSAPAVVASVRALRDRGLPVAVNLGSPVPAPGAPDPFGMAAVAAAVLDTGAAALTPTAYLENHVAPWALGPLAGGELVYPRPADDVIAWIAAGDVAGAAAAAAVAALAADVQGELLALAGPERLTFDALAAEIGHGLARPVVFRRVSPESYGEMLRPILGDGAAAGVAAAYGAMPETANPAMAVDAGVAWARLGLAPTSARRWAATVLAPALAAGARR